MDSGNSGSMQSSSGGDEDQYNNDSSSRAEQSLPPSPFLIPNNPSSLSSSSSSIPHHHHHDPSSSSNYLSFFNNHPFNMMPQFPNLGKNTHVGPSSSSANLGRPSADPRAGSTLNVTKNPKKRTRASRRAPTTVLTTDTSNFRAMVQEFTGIPAPPFSTAGSPFSSRRFDIFRSSSSNQGIMDHQNNNSLYYNPFLGPPTQKIRMSLPPNNNISSVPMNYPVIPDLPLPRAPSNNMNTHIQQNPNLSFQSLLAQHHQTQEHHQQHSGIPYDVGLLPRDDHQDQRLRSTHLNVSVEEFEKQNNNTNVSASRTEGTSVDSWICPAD